MKYFQGVRGKIFFEDFICVLIRLKLFFVLGEIELQGEVVVSIVMWFDLEVRVQFFLGWGLSYNRVLYVLLSGDFELLFFGGNFVWGIIGC